MNIRAMRIHVRDISIRGKAIRADARATSFGSEEIAIYIQGMVVHILEIAARTQEMSINSQEMRADIQEPTACR